MVKHQLKMEERFIVVTQRLQGDSYKKIADLNGISKSTAYRIWLQWLMNKNFERKLQSGRPKKLSVRLINKIIRFIKKYPQSNLRKIIESLHLNIFFKNSFKHSSQAQI